MIFASLTTSALVTVTSIIFLLTIICYEITNPKKYIGLRKWIVGSIAFAIGISIINTFNIFIKDSNNRYIVSLGYLLLIAGVHIVTITLVNKFEIKKHYHVLLRVLSVLTIITLLLFTFLDYGYFFTYLTTGYIVILYLIQILSVNYSNNPRLRNRWYWFSVINLISLFLSSLFIVERVYIGNEHLNLLINESNSLALVFLTSSIFNMIGIISVIFRKDAEKMDSFIYSLEKISGLTKMINVLIDANSKKVVYADNSFLSKLNIRRKEAIESMYFKDIFDKEEQYHYVIHDLLNKKELVEYKINLKNNHNNNKLRYYMYSKSILIEGRYYYFITLYDVTRSTHEKMNYQYLALHDELTSLPNRRKLVEEFNRRKAINNPFSLIILDVDKFKLINDNYGHLVGDELLREISLKLATLANKEVIVSRYGGDEFAFIVSATKRNDLDKVCSSVIETFNNKYMIKGIEIQSDVSMGISRYPNNGTTFLDLVEKADKALYVSKKFNGSKYEIYKDK